MHVFRPPQFLRRAVNRNPRVCFYLVSASGMVLFFFLCLITGQGFPWVVMENQNTWFMSDFFRHVLAASDLSQTYELGSYTSFPPLSYLFFHLVYLLNPVSTEDYGVVTYQNAPFQGILYIMYLLLLTLAFLLIIYKITRFSQEECILITGLLSCSIPFFAGAIERGNTVYLAMVLLLWALYLRESGSPAKRELALVLIAVAVNLKLSPIIFELLYLKERRWREGVRLAVYSAVLFFVPFLFTGGFAGFQRYFGYLFFYARRQFQNYMSFRAIAYTILTKLGAPRIFSHRLGILVECAAMLLLVALFALDRSRWRSIGFLCFAMTYYIPNNYRYTAVYLAIPLLLLFRESASDTSPPPHLKLYLCLFGLIFTIPVWCYPRLPELGMSAAAMLLLMTEAVHVLGNVRTQRRMARASANPAATGDGGGPAA